ncbi:hypothetical protein DMX11_21995 [Pseudomonas sp. LB-090624]|nr:hypothetical protein DMX11_21995 [Pseudomonas sp. LB-090624]
MLKPTEFRCTIVLPLLICGCQFYSRPPMAVRCLSPPSPEAWFMEECAPDLTQRLLNALCG